MRGRRVGNWMGGMSVSVAAARARVGSALHYWRVRGRGCARAGAWGRDALLRVEQKLKRATARRLDRPHQKPTPEADQDARLPGY
jgi:hypothetical protein